MIMCFDILFIVCCLFCFFFKQKTAYEMRISDWSSDVCSSDLVDAELARDRFDLVPFGRIGPGESEFHQRCESGKIGVLLEEDDARARLDLAFTPVGLDAIVDQPHQRGLARAIDRKSTRLNSSH